jgi:beta-glucosidase
VHHPSDPGLAALLAKLTLEEKVQLLTGRDFWTTWPIEKIGLRRILFSDGPSGVRGENWDERDPSLNLPSATALAASWDLVIAARYGAAAAVEARRKGVDVVLGPTVNLHRSPLGGRSFEAFSEDPVLTADLAAAYVVGLQDNGVAATPKHYVANDYETDRFTADTIVSDRALRELYLFAFEKAVVEAHTWALMSSYNSVNGVTASENELLETPLNSEWGYDGIVVSDWTGVRSVAAARASQDLAMPGPVGAWGDALLDAVRSGEVTEAAIDRKVLRILALAARVGALDGFDAVVPEPVTVEDGVAFTREAEAAGSVLVQNDGILPLAPSGIRKIAVIGHNATLARTMGGGSATVVPEKIVSPLEGIREAYPDAQVDYAVGAVVQSGVAPLALDDLVNPATGGPGVRARFLNAAGDEIYTEDRRATNLVWIGSGAPVGETEVLELTTRWTAPETAAVPFGIAAVGRTIVTIDGVQLFDETLVAAGDDLGAALLSPGTTSKSLDVVAGKAYDIRIEYRRVDSALLGAMAFSFGLEATDEAPERLIAEAEQLARDADVVILVVGTNSAVESEGFDRTSLALPGSQDELAVRVLAANSRAIVVVNSGAPVVLPWSGSASAILLTWFGGQEFGHALGDVLTGAVEPGGRLPTTWPASESDVPVLDVTPREGAVRYDEGIHIGYRAWLKAEATPAWPFGYGLGYTTWSLGSIAATPDVELGAEVTVTVTLTNTGDRAGKQVVQVYASRAESSVDRPVRWLVGFAAVTAAASATVTADILVPARAFAHWDDGWQYEAGEFILEAGFAVDALPLPVPVELRAP